MIAGSARRRIGELARLTWSDIDLKRGVIRVHSAWTADRQGTKSTKSGMVKKIQIEPNLLPLSEKMKEQTKGKGPLFASLPPEESLAKRLREDLAWAGCDRADLTSYDLVRRAHRFQDPRATGLTWQSVRGNDALEIQRAAGHSSRNPTQIYIREAECRDVRHAVPSPPDHSLLVMRRPRPRTPRVG